MGNIKIGCEFHHASGALQFAEKTGQARGRLAHGARQRFEFGQGLAAKAQGGFHPFRQQGISRRELLPVARRVQAVAGLLDPSRGQQPRDERAEHAGIEARTDLFVQRGGRHGGGARLRAQVGDDGAVQAVEQNVRGGGEGDPGIIAQFFAHQVGAMRQTLAQRFRCLRQLFRQRRYPPAVGAARLEPRLQRLTGIRRLQALQARAPFGPRDGATGGERIEHHTATHGDFRRFVAQDEAVAVQQRHALIQPQLRQPRAVFRRCADPREARKRLRRAAVETQPLAVARPVL